MFVLQKEQLIDINEGESENFEFGEWRTTGIPQWGFCISFVIFSFVFKNLNGTW